MRTDGTGRVVVASLFAPLVLLLIVAGMTWRSERRLAAVTDRVVHDYAAIAVWQYARRVNTALHDEVMQAFGPSRAPGHARTGTQTVVEPPSLLLAKRLEHTSRIQQHAHFAFTYDTRTDRLLTAGDTIGSRTLSLVRRRVRAAGAIKPGDEPHRALFDSADGHSYAIALWVIGNGEGRTHLVKGLVAEASVLDSVFARVLAQPGILPATTGTAKDMSDDLALQLTRGDGGRVFSTPRAPGRTAATDTTGLQLADLRATIDLPPEVARVLLVGLAPTSQLPALALMIVAASVLAVVGLVHHSRSSALGQARTRFVANASHELRTPLAQISMFAETLHLGRERSEAEGRQFAGIIFAEARRLTTLVENVLRFSRSEHAAPELQLEPHEITQLIERAVAAFSPIAVAADARVDVAIAGGARARVDAAAFQQIMLNLLDNAIKHGDGRGVRITASEGEGETRVTVEDEGPGVPEEWRTRVFEPFAQVGGRNVAGAGIGLAIVRDLVLAHGGRVWIDEAALGGARVTVALPVAP